MSNFSKLILSAGLGAMLLMMVADFVIVTFGRSESQSLPPPSTSVASNRVLMVERDLNRFKQGVIAYCKSEDVSEIEISLRSRELVFGLEMLKLADSESYQKLIPDAGSYYVTLLESYRYQTSINQPAQVTHDAIASHVRRLGITFDPPLRVIKLLPLFQEPQSRSDHIIDGSPLSWNEEGTSPSVLGEVRSAPSVEVTYSLYQPDLSPSREVRGRSVGRSSTVSDTQKTGSSR